jgi:hypothetical protein
MSNFFRRLKVAWEFLHKYPVVVLPDNYWTDADAKAWSNFLGSDTGAKLRHMRWNRVYQSQQNAICDRKDSTFSAGIAFGVLGMTREEDGLLQISLPESGSQENTRGTSDFRSVNR